MDNKALLAEKKFLINCGYSLEEVKKLTEGFGVTDVPSNDTNSISTINNREITFNKDEFNNLKRRFNELSSVVNNVFKGSVPAEISQLVNDIKIYFNK